MARCCPVMIAMEKQRSLKKFGKIARENVEVSRIPNYSQIAGPILEKL